MNVFVTLRAGFQFPSPACEATMLTEPAFVKVSVSPFSTACPDTTPNATASPEVAVAVKVTTLVVTWPPGFGNEMPWSALATTSVPAV